MGGENCYQLGTTNTGSPQPISIVWTPCFRVPILLGFTFKAIVGKLTHHGYLAKGPRLGVDCDSKHCLSTYLKIRTQHARSLTSSFADGLL